MICIENLTYVSEVFSTINIFILQDKEWFAGACNRKRAEDLLLGVNKVNQTKLIPWYYYQPMMNHFNHNQLFFNQANTRT